MDKGGVTLRLIATIKKADSNESLVNDRIYSRAINNITNLGYCICDVAVDVVYSLSGLHSFFRDDYGSEVSRLLNSLEYFDEIQKKWTEIPVDRFELFKTITTTYESSWKRLLQHIYTHDKIEGPQMYETIKTAIQLEKKEPQKAELLLKEFLEKYYKHRRGQMHIPYPDFGACDVCLDKLRFFRFFHYTDIRTHKKTLKEKDPSFWDLYSQNSESK